MGYCGKIRDIVEIRREYTYLVVAPNDLEKEVVKWFESCVLLAPEEVVNKNYYVVDYPDGSKSLIGHYSGVPGCEYEVEKLYLVDFDSYGEKTGHTSVDYKTGTLVPSLFDGKPRVEDTETGEKYRGNGYAGRRLCVLNNMCEAIFEKKLHSDFMLLPGAIRVWDKMVGQGLAEKYQEEGMPWPWYRFF